MKIIHIFFLIFIVYYCNCDFNCSNNDSIKIHNIVEPYPLGTAGSLKLIEEKLNERFLVFYGDVVMDFDIDSFIEFDKQHPQSVGTTLVHPNDHPYDSSLIVTKDKRVIEWLSKEDERLYYKNRVNYLVYIIFLAGGNLNG